MADSEARMPRPTAVPPCGERRFTAASTWLRLVVGRWAMTPLSPNATTPIRMDGGWFSTNRRAAAFAASIREGRRSVAAMLVDTSKARITVPSRRGSRIVAWGRASPIASRDKAASSSTGPRCRRRLSAEPAPPTTSPRAASCCRRSAWRAASRR